MATREEFLKQLWDEIINPTMQEHWIDNIIRAARERSDSPFAEVGPALERLLAQGASSRCLFAFHACRLMFRARL